MALGLRAYNNFPWAMGRPKVLRAPDILRFSRIPGDTCWAAMTDPAQAMRDVAYDHEPRVILRTIQFKPWALQLSARVPPQERVLKNGFGGICVLTVFPGTRTWWFEWKIKHVMEENLKDYIDLIEDEGLVGDKLFVFVGCYTEAGSADPFEEKMGGIPHDRSKVRRIKI
eukprot:1095056-Amorphochlora_amoeboformis.AAC.3